MRLKSIHIHGFKSFAERTVIQYAKGITGVIGPNGSGKSNVIDAVRWVMGEQTAKSLRADDPTDIIFAGSDNRKPLSMAEVTLTFYNDGGRCPPEYLHLPEVSIGRRIYRSGEREYFMNGEDCRLKDIVDFLMSIGLGSKSYSIIQQERRDRIIQAGPNDMREILEETAGISIFKTRRKEAEKRLESTREKLVSLADLEHEFNSQSSSLREQVEKAQKKSDFLAELREKEIIVIAKRTTTSKEEITKIQIELDSKQKETNQGEMQTLEWETQANDCQSERLEVLAQISSEVSAYDEKRLSLTKYQTKIEGILGMAEERKRRKSHLNEELVREKEALTKDEEQIKVYSDELSTSEKDQEKISLVMAQLLEQLEVHDEEVQVESGRGQEILSEMRATREAIQRLQIESEGFLKDLEKSNSVTLKLTEERTNLDDELGKIQADKLHVEEAIRGLSGGLEGFSVEKSRLDATLGALEDEAQNARDHRDSAKDHQITASSHVQSLTKILNQGSGLSSGTQALREHLSDFVEGFFFEKFRAHKEDEAILELAIPDLLEAALIVNTDQMMELLDKAEETGVSRVGFLVSEHISDWSSLEQTALEKLLTHQGVRNVAARATNIVSSKVQSFLSRVWIVRDEWMALKLQREAQSLAVNTFLFVSERGTVLGSGPREITYGPKEGGEGQGLLARKRELEEWQVKLEDAQGVLATSEGTLFEIQTKRKSVELRLLDVNQQLSKEKDEVQKLGSQLSGLDLQFKIKSEAGHKISSQWNELQTEMVLAKEAFQKHAHQISKLESEDRELTRQNLEFEESYRDKKELRDEVQSQIQSRKNDLSVHSTKLSFVRSAYEQTAHHLQRSADKVQRVLEELAHFDEQMSGSQDQVVSLEKEVEGLQKEIVTMGVRLEELRARESEADEQIRTIESRIKKAQSSKESILKFINDKRLEIARHEMILETAQSEAWEKFKVEPKNIPLIGPDDVRWSGGLEKRIKEIQKSLEELGPVNEGALDEFRKVEEKRIFLIQQKEDIERSMLDLQSSISVIEEQTRVKFHDIFHEVNNQFQKLFPILFPGGHAELKMLVPEDLLATGVEIQVKLPGKNMQNMNLFSGGEKALTAISLIFSLLKTTPAPFCFLDEVDAPLDEANVGRFNQVLEALSDQFQFVVITHNRRTMEVLDTVYGISMPERGVSKLVSADLSEVEPHLQKKPKLVTVPRAGADSGSAAATEAAVSNAETT